MCKELVFLNGNVHRDQVQKPKAEPFLYMYELEKEALKKMKLTGMEANKAGNIFRGRWATTECYNQVHDMYKKQYVIHSTRMLITTYLCKDTGYKRSDS